ncbi:MAG: HpcH/HpaI aldolase/citrate lyase family protein [Candidatus Binataceae bacterium]
MAEIVASESTNAGPLVRSRLYVPGSRPELFEKALRSPADAITFDLEDSVLDTCKATARLAIAAALDRARPGSGKTLVVRCNAVGSESFEADIETVVRAGLDLLCLPKTETPGEIRYVARRLDLLERTHGMSSSVRLLPTIETARGMRHASRIARADHRIVGLQLGLGDLLGSLGIDRSEQHAAYVCRLAVRFAAAEAAVAAYDAAFPGISDLDGFRIEARAARRLGYAGKSCIHPAQVQLANEVFRPTAGEIAHARRVVSIADAKAREGLGAFVVDGVMVDKPAVEHARAMLRQATQVEQDG